MATIKIPPVLRESVGNEKQVDALGSNIGEVLRNLVSNHPSTKSRLFSADGELNRYVNVYLNGEDVRVLNGLDTAAEETDTIVILPAMAGGGEAPTINRKETSARKQQTLGEVTARAHKHLASAGEFKITQETVPSGIRTIPERLLECVGLAPHSAPLSNHKGNSTIPDDHDSVPTGSLPLPRVARKLLRLK